MNVSEQTQVLQLSTEGPSGPQMAALPRDEGGRRDTRVTWNGSCRSAQVGHRCLQRQEMLSVEHAWLGT